MRKKLESLLLDALDDYKTLNIVNINVQKLTTEMDSMIIATGTSTRHVKSASSSLVEYAKKLDSLSSNVIIRAEDAIGFDDYVLFDVYNHKKVNSRSRFQMRAKTIDDILIGIREFVKISNFILSVNDR